MCVVCKRLNIRVKGEESLEMEEKGLSFGGQERKMLREEKKSRGVV